MLSDKIGWLFVLVGVALIIYGLVESRTRRKQKKRLMKIQLCSQSCDEQERREA